MAGLLSIARAGVIGSFLPKTMHTRVVMHSCATISGAALAVRFWPGGPMLAVAAYLGGFVGFHVIMCPFYSMWVAFAGGMHRWVQSIVEEELIRYDMKTYNAQLQRIMPDGHKHGDASTADGTRQDTRGGR